MFITPQVFALPGFFIERIPKNVKRLRREISPRTDF
jgi:hypothetical protein